MRALYVTPDLADADVLQRELDRHSDDIRVDPCVSVTEARSRIEYVAYEAFLLDTVLTGQDGLQLVADLRTHASDVPIVALTRTANEDDVAMATVAGADQCIAKRANWVASIGAALHAAEATRQKVSSELGSPLTLDFSPQSAGFQSPTTDPADATAQSAGPSDPDPAAPEETPEPPPRREAAGGAQAQPDLETLREILSRERRARQEAEAELAALSARHQTDRIAWDQMLQQIQHRQDSLAEVDASRMNLQEAIAAAEARQVALLDERREDSRKLESALAQLTAERTALAQADAERARLEAELVDTRRAHFELLTQQEASTVAVGDLRQRVGQLAETNSQLQATYAALEAKMREALDRVETLASALADRERQVEELLAERSRREVIFREAEEERRELLTRVTLLSSELERLRQHATELEARLEEERDTGRRLALEHDAALKEMTRSLEESREGGARLQATITSLEATAAALRARMEGDQARLEMAVAEAEGARTEAARREAAVEAELAESRATRNEALAELSRVRAALEDAVVERATLERSLREAMERAEAQVGRLEALEMGQSEAQREAADLRSALAATEQGRREAEEAAQALAGRLDGIAAEQAGAQRELAEVRAALAAAERVRDEALERASLGERGAEVVAALADRERQLADLERRVQHAVSLDARWSQRLGVSGVLGLASTTADGTLLNWNGVFAGLCGLPLLDAIAAESSRTMPLVLDPGCLARSSAVRRSDIGTTAGETVLAEDVIVVEACLEHPDGRLAWVQATGWPTESPSGSAHEWAVFDVTDRRHGSERVRALARLELLSEMASSAGPALLAALEGTPKGGAGDSATAGELDQAQDHLRQLLAYARVGGPRPLVVDLNRTLCDLLPVVRALLAPGVTLTARLEDRPIRTCADGDELTRVLVMLAVTVLDALPAGGTVSVTSSLADREAPGASGSPLRPSAVVRMIASGLGVRPLSGVDRVREVVKGMEGFVTAAHEAGRNATAELALPLVLAVGR